MTETTISLDGENFFNTIIVDPRGTLAIGGTFYTDTQFTVSGTAENTTLLGPEAAIDIEPKALSLYITLGNSVSGLNYENVWGTASFTSVIGGDLSGLAGSTIVAAQITNLGGQVTIYAGAKAVNMKDAGTAVIYGTDDQDTVSRFQDIELGGTSNAATIIAGGVQDVWGLANNDLVERGGQADILGVLDGAVVDQGTVYAIAGSTLSKGVFIDGGTIIAQAGATIKGEITFGSSGGTLTNSGTHNLTIAGFTSGDEIILSGTTIPKSRHVTLNSKGVLTIGSIEETFAHGAGMVLNLTSTSSGVEITEKASSANTSAVSSSNASLEIFANLWNNPKMDFIGSALADEPLGETHLGKTSFAALSGHDCKVADIIGLNGAATSELTLIHPTISTGAQSTTLTFQNSILSITTFSVG